MCHKFKLNEGAEAEAKAKELSSQNSGNMYVIAGTDKNRNEEWNGEWIKVS